jgi:hypothetical protein
MREAAVPGKVPITSGTIHAMKVINANKVNRMDSPMESRYRVVVFMDAPTMGTNMWPQICGTNSLTGALMILFEHYTGGVPVLRSPDVKFIDPLYRCRLCSPRL